VRWWLSGEARTYCYRKGCVFESVKTQMFFWHEIKLNWLYCVHQDYWWSSARVLQDCIRGPGIVSIRSLPGVQQDSLIVYSGCYLREVQMDSRKTPDGVHQDLWLSVTTSFFACIHHPLLESGHNPVSSSWSLRLLSRFVRSCSFF